MIPSIVAAQTVMRLEEERRKKLKEKPKGITFGRGNPMPLSNEEITEIATKTADEVMERISLEREERELRDHIISGAMGEGAIPLYGRETRTEPCSCCLIEPEGPSEPANRMCTTSGAIGTLKDSEEREWCSVINIVPDGRCERARSIREAARECKEKYPEDTAKFFECYAPAFSKVTKGSNPYPRMTIPEPYTRKVRAELRKVPTWRLKEAYEALGAGKATGIEVVETDRAHALSALREILWERGQLPPEVLADYPELIKGGSSTAAAQEYVTITDPGKTTFKPGEIVSREAFEKENERVKRLGESPATGR